MSPKTVVILLAAVLALPSHSQELSPWAQIALADLEDIYQNVKENHPGAVDEENGYFRTWLEKGYTEGRKRAAKANSLQDVFNTLTYYVAGFADGHFSLGLSYEPRNQEWVGLGLAKEGDRYVVVHREEDWPSDLPPKAAELVSCDGRSADQMMIEDLLKYRFGNFDLNAPKVRFASKLLTWDQVGERKQSQECRFATPAGEEPYSLQWRRIRSPKLPAKLNPALRSTEFKISESVVDHYWVALPNFHPNAGQQEDIRRIMEALEKNRDADLVVFDVRGNGGGNSQWGEDLARALYGDQYIEATISEHSSESYALWRVSSGNWDHLKDISERVSDQFGEGSEVHQVFRQTADDMETALHNRVDFVRQAQFEDPESEGSEEHQWTLANTEAETNASVVLLTDHRCGSACLDFADLMLAIPSVLHMGGETSADTVYMDIRQFDLPSGLGGYSLALKVYRNRERAHNESYRPEVPYPGDMGDTESLKAWVMEQVLGEQGVEGETN